MFQPAKGLTSTKEITAKVLSRVARWEKGEEIRLVEETNPEWRDLHDEIDVLATLVQD
jgi:hypothetical protein